MATSAGERTALRRQESIYKTTAESASSPVYSSYDNVYTLSNNCLKSVSNYQGLLDILKGKSYINPQLDGAAAAKAHIWAGNFVVVDLSGGFESSVTSIVQDGSSIKLDPSFNTITFPAPVYSGGSGFGGGQNYPGWIMDPSAAGLLECFSSTSLPIYFERFGKVAYRSSQDYWNAVTYGDRLNGFSYPSRVAFVMQPTDTNTPTALIYAPKASYNSNTPEQQLARWCNQ